MAVQMARVGLVGKVTRQSGFHRGQQRGRLGSVSNAPSTACSARRTGGQTHKRHDVGGPFKHGGHDLPHRQRERTAGPCALPCPALPREHLGRCSCAALHSASQYTAPGCSGRRCTRRTRYALHRQRAGLARACTASASARNSSARRGGHLRRFRALVRAPAGRSGAVCCHAAARSPCGLSTARPAPAGGPGRPAWCGHLEHPAAQSASSTGRTGCGAA